MKVAKTGVVESWSDGGTPGHAQRRIPSARMNFVAAAGLRHSRAPGKNRGRCGKRPYRATGGVIRSGPRRYANRAFTGLSGREVGKATDFDRLATALTRLFPHDSTQVVDFPHLAVVRRFWDGPEIGFGHGWNTEGARMGTDLDQKRIGQAMIGTGTVRNYARKLPAFIAKFQVLSDIIAHRRPVLPHFLAYYRSEPFSITRPANEANRRNEASRP